MITIKNEKQISYMREAGKILSGLFQELEKVIKPGISTLELDKIAHAYIIEHKAKPSFLHYQGFPATLCTSVDDVVVHGIPRADQILQEGQIIGVDVGAVVHGYHADAARTYAVGNISPEKQKLIDVTKQSFFEGIKNIKEGSRLGDIGGAVQEYVEKHGFSVVRDLVGHGVGANLHEAPNVPNYGNKGTGMKLVAGMTLAVEPMVNMGSYAMSFPKEWVCKTRDGLPSAHYENTIVITKTGVEILTL